MLVCLTCRCATCEGAASQRIRAAATTAELASMMRRPFGMLKLCSLHTTLMYAAVLYMLLRYTPSPKPKMQDEQAGSLQTAAAAGYRCICTNDVSTILYLLLAGHIM